MAGLVVAVPSLAIDRAAGSQRPGRALQQWHDHDGRLIATGGRDHGAWWMHWAGLATFWFGEAGEVRVETLRSGADEEVQDIFTRGVIPVVLLARGFEGLHASAVQDEEGVIGLCATSGTGKSTVAFALASDGQQHFADDTLVYRIDDGRPVASRLPFPVRIDQSAREAAQREKVLSFVRLEGVGSAPIRLIYLLRRDPSLDPRTPRFSIVPAAKRFEALLAHAHPFDMGDAARRAAFLSSVLTLARTTTLCECSFAPALDQLSALAAAIRQHARLQ